MRKLIGLVFILIAVSIAFFSYLTFWSKSKADLSSPLPKAAESILGEKSDSFFYSENLWLPQDVVTLPGVNLPQVTAEAVYVIDITGDKVLYAKNVHERRPIASTVKIMTAAIALERAKPIEVFTVSENAAKIGEDFMGATAGERYTLSELLYGLLLPSGNDAAEVLAEGVGGSRANFVKLMNEKASLLGLRDTKFVNPSGLDGDGEHYSSAYDLAVIAHYAWVNFPLFRQVVGTYDIVLPYSDDHKYLYLQNQTNLLTSYPGVKGIKPGYTPDAGLCLVTLAERDEHQVLGVILGSTDRRGDMEMLLDYSFATLGVK